MCGIFAVTGKAARPELVREALMRLEYRGYDSFGIGGFANGAMKVDKRVGPISSVSEAAFANAFDGHGALIGHTRWATHGRVSRVNSHPHFSTDEEVLVVHNGVIENNIELRSELEAHGVVFRTDTDTEVVAQHLAHGLRSGLSTEEAISATMAVLEGEYALAILFANEPDALYVTSRKSPLLYAISNDSLYVASDRSALADWVSTATVVPQETVIRLAPGEPLRVVGNAGLIEGLEVDVAPFATSKVKSAGSSFMEAEIGETADAIDQILELDARLFLDAVSGTGRLVLTGSGSAYYATRIAQYLFKDLAGLSVTTVPSDEMTELLKLGPDDTLVAVSQSGETFDTLEAVRAAKEGGARIVSICNVEMSALEQLADLRIPQRSGLEVCVLSTKSILAQVTALCRLALAARSIAGQSMDPEFATTRGLENVSKLIDRLLQDETAQMIGDIARKRAHYRHWLFIGRGIHYAVALEGALKFKEVSYQHAEALPAGFLKHGTISLISDEFMTVGWLPPIDSAQWAPMMSNVSEVLARDGSLILFGPRAGADLVPPGQVLYVPLDFSTSLEAAFVQLVAGQLFALHAAEALGRNVDRPRALAKSVTVR